METKISKDIFWGIVAIFILVCVGSCVGACCEEDKPLTREEIQQIEQREMRKRLKNAKETIVVYSDGSIGYAITY